MGPAWNAPETLDRTRLRVSAGAWFLALLVSVSGPAASECTSIKPITTRGQDSIGLVYEAPISRRVVEKATDYWRACANYGKGFPSFVLAKPETGSQAQTLRITYVLSSSSRKCGSVRGHTITLHGFARLEDGRRISCASLAQNLAHELGHVLGLNHAAELPACQYNIMSLIQARNGHRRQVTAEECQLVGQYWLTTMEIARLDRLSERTGEGGLAGGVTR